MDCYARRVVQYVAPDETLIRIVTDAARSEVEVVAQLLEAGEAAAPVLRAGLTDSRLSVRGRVAAALARVDEPVFREVQAGLDEAAVYALCSSYMLQQPEFACAAARALGRLRDRRAVSALCTWVEHDDADVRRAAAEALGAIGHPGAVAPLCRLVASGTARTMSRHLHNGLPPAPAAVRTEVAVVAAKALGQLADSRALSCLVDALDSDEPALRSAAAGALGRIGGPTARQNLYRRLVRAVSRTDEDPVPLLDALATMGKPAVPSLCTVLILHDPRLLCATLETLARIGDGYAVASVRRCLRNQDPEVRRTAAQTLVALNWQPGTPEEAVFVSLSAGDQERLVMLGASAVEPLAHWLGKGAWWVRLAAAELLGRLERREALPFLEKRLAGPLGEPREEVRTAIREAIRRIEATTGESSRLPRAAADSPLLEGRPREGTDVPTAQRRPRDG